MYASMAYYLAEKLNLRPNDILELWTVPELIVAYGNYANQDAKKNFNEWKHLPPKERAKISRPMEYAVYFRGA